MTLRRHCRLLPERLARQRGFTLVEMLVSVLLMTMIGGAVVQGLRYAQHAYRASTKLRTQDWEIFATRRFLHGILQSTSPDGGSATASGTSSSFEGAGDRLVFTAPASRSFSDIGPIRYEITLVRQAGNPALGDLVLYSEPVSGTSTSGPAGEPETLVRNLQSAQWSYLESADGSDDVGEDWETQWQSRSALPALVRLRVNFPEGDTRRWPDFIVSLRLTQDANCVFDVVSQGCRT